MDLMMCYRRSISHGKKSLLLPSTQQVSNGGGIIWEKRNGSRLLHFLLPKLRRLQTTRSEYNTLTNEATTINNNEISSKVLVSEKKSAENTYKLHNQLWTRPIKTLDAKCALLTIDLLLFFLLHLVISCLIAVHEILFFSCHQFKQVAVLGSADLSRS